MSAADSDISRAKRETETVEIFFPYFKQGDDFSGCEGNLENFINLHQAVIDQARNILELIPLNMRNQVTGDGNTHFCTLSGPRSVMENLVKNGLARYIDYEDDE